MNQSDRIADNGVGNGSISASAQGSIITEEAREAGLFAIDCILTPIFTSAGFIGNTLSMIVLLHHSMRNGVNICLAALSVSDSFFLVTVMIRRAFCIIEKFDPLEADWFFVRMFPSMFYLNLVFGRITTLLTVLITVNRFIAVVFPFRAQVWSTRRKMLIAIVVIYIACFLLVLPTAFAYEVGEAFVPVLNITQPFLSPTTFFRENEQFILDYSQTFLVIFFRYIPAIALVVLNIWIAVALNRSSKFRASLSRNLPKDHNKLDDQKSVTKLLLAISGLFLLCLIPGCLLILLNQLIYEFSFSGKYHNLYVLISAITIFLEVINSSVNFILYMVMSKSFSHIYWQLFGCSIKGKRNKPTAN